MTNDDANPQVGGEIRTAQGPDGTITWLGGKVTIGDLEIPVDRMVNLEGKLIRAGDTITVAEVNSSAFVAVKGGESADLAIDQLRHAMAVVRARVERDEALMSGDPERN